MARETDIRGIPFVYLKKACICLEPICLDIETSYNHAEKVEDLITWVSSIQVYFNGCYYLLRKPEQLCDFYKFIYDQLDLEPSDDKVPRKIYTYIHNASFDLSYLIPYFRQYLPYIEGEPSGIIEGNNKILTYSQGCFEWRCTYRLTQLSLEAWTKDMHVEHIKQVGLYDYEAIIYQDTELTENQKIYDRNDVVGLYEALQTQNNYHGDNIASMPLTLTGYCRRDLRRSCQKSKYYRKNYFLKNRLDAEIYYCFLKSFCGGYTHNNRFYKGITVSIGNKYRFFNEEIRVHNIGHRDFKSHYPTQMTCYKFPLGVPQLIYDVNNDIREPITIAELLSLYPKFYTMSVVRIRKAELSDKRISMPFMQYSKCHEAHFTSIRQDNGRIVYAAGEWIMFLDNLTLQILDEQYDMDYEIIKAWRIEAKPLPPEIVNIVDKYFKGKSDKKNIVTDLEEKYGRTDERCYKAQSDLSITKKLLNSLYGCCATNPLRTSYEIGDSMDFKIKESYGTLDEMQDGLNEYYDKWSNFLSYAVGCTVTALARFELYEYIKAIGYKKVLYCDTDSIFYIKDSKTEKAIENLNKSKADKAHFVTLDNGKKEYYDAFTPEPDLKAFRGLHSKCYGVVTKDKNKLELTIAGVPAKTLVDMKDGEPVFFTREQELQGNIKDPVKALDNLTDNFTFTVNTGKTAVYVGAIGGIDGLREPTILNIDGHEISTAGGCIIRTLKEKRVHDIPYDLNAYEYLDDAIENIIPFYEFIDIPNDW